MIKLRDMIYNKKSILSVDKARLALSCGIDYDSIVGMAEGGFPIVLNCEVDASRFIPIVDMSDIHSLVCFFRYNNASVIDLRSQDLRQVVYVEYLFNRCSAKSILFNPKYKLELQADGMFLECYNIESLDLSMIDLISYNYIFDDCPKLKCVKVNRYYLGLERKYPDIHFEVVSNG